MKNPAFNRLIVANMISGFSQGITMLAIPWYFVKTLDLAETFGLSYAVITIASIFWSPVAGSIIDRFSRKRIFQWITLVGGLFMITLSLLFKDMPWPIAMLAFTFTMFHYQIHYPCVYAFTQEISPPNAYQSMNSKIEIQGQATNVIAGAIGAVLLSGYAGGEFLGITLPPIASWDLSDIIFLDGCTYLGACLVVSTIKYEQTIKDKIDKSPLLNRLKNGFNFLRNRPHLFWFGTASYSVFVFLLVQIHQLLPMYINNHLSEGTFTFAMSEMLYSVGALLTGITLSKLLGTMNKIQAIILLLAMAACIALWLVFTQSVLVLMIFSLLIGISNAGARILRVTYLFEHTPNELLGRTSSVFHMINVLIRFLFISLFALPFFSTDNNVIYAYLISAVFLTVSILPLYLLRKKLTT